MCARAYVCVSPMRGWGIVSGNHYRLQQHEGSGASSDISGLRSHCSLAALCSPVQRMSVCVWI